MSLTVGQQPFAGGGRQWAAVQKSLGIGGAERQQAMGSRKVGRQVGSGLRWAGSTGAGGWCGAGVSAGPDLRWSAGSFRARGGAAGGAAEGGAPGPPPPPPTAHRAGGSHRLGEFSAGGAQGLAGSRAA